MSQQLFVVVILPHLFMKTLRLTLIYKENNLVCLVNMSVTDWTVQITYNSDILLHCFFCHNMLKESNSFIQIILWICYKQCTCLFSLFIHILIEMLTCMFLSFSPSFLIIFCAYSPLCWKNLSLHIVSLNWCICYIFWSPC